MVSEPLVSWVKKHRVYRLPVIRGIVALGESLSIGFKALGISANAQMPGKKSLNEIFDVMVMRLLS